MPAFIFTLAFSNEKNKILSDVRSTLRHNPLTVTKVKLGKRPEVNSKPTHFLYIYNGMAFPDLCGIQPLVPWTVTASTRAQAIQKKIFWDLQKLN